MTALHALLQRETASHHKHLEVLPFFEALHARTLSRLAIVSFLRSLSIIHAVLERGLAETAHKEVGELFQHAGPKTPLLQADLEALNAVGLPSNSAAIQSALKYGAEIVANSENTAALVGVLYVLEGSQNGGVALKHVYAQCLGVEKEKLSYFGCYGIETASRWKMFVGRLNSISFSDEQTNDVVLSAKHCFEQIGEICAGLFPYSDNDLKHHVTEINFEAGDHAMPQNPLEIDLALRVGKVAWEQFPYLQLRFGDRGKRFTGSDSCWLVSLMHMHVDTATKSLRWLRAVLASRGIPTVILEGHLRIIIKTHAEQFPDQIEMRTRFDQFLEGLDTERQERGDTGVISRLIETFNQRFDSCDGLTVASAAQLIVSAWFDERAGIASSLVAVQSWFTDTERFSNGWVSTANELLTELKKTEASPC